MTSACASITEGNKQSVSVTTAPVAGAGCSLTNDGGTYFVTQTPGSVIVTRSAADMVITCKKDGHQDATVSVASVTKALAFGNIIAGGLIGAAIDRGTGAAFDYPAMITVPMMPVGPLQPTPSDPARPAADRLRELQDLKDRGLITTVEFDQRRQAIVERL
jgi:hypothetical protein